MAKQAARSHLSLVSSRASRNARTSRASRAAGPARLPCAPATTPPAPADSARAAGLRYTSDGGPGIRRVRRGRAFAYLMPDGSPVRAADELARIRALVIPPAWTSVWICPDPRGHLQATGRDVRGRKQYRYHPRWRVVRDDTKYHRMIGFAQALPGIRRRTAAHLRRPGLSREKVLAAVVRLLERTLIRVGNDEYARTNRSYGLTTLRDGHVAVSGTRMRFTFRGKSGVEHEIDLQDRRLARIVKQCRDLPGQELFQYLDEAGVRQTIGSEEVNAYLKAVSGQELSSKDFRTWAGTVLAAQLLAVCEPCSSETQGKRTIVRAVDVVASRLGNTKAVCRKCYIHPAVFDAFMDGSLHGAVVCADEIGTAGERLSAGEAAVLALLQRRLARESKRKAS